MSTDATRPAHPPLAQLPSILPGLETLYTDVHAHSELNPRFLPAIHPTLETGVGAVVVAARAWLWTSPS